MGSIDQLAKQDRVVFLSGESNHTIGDVIDAAHFRGEIEPIWKQLLRRIAAERRGCESEEELDDAELESAAVAFRYQYDLITAEETESWLEARGLNLPDFSEYFARAQWEKIFGSKAEPQALKFEEASAELHQLLVIEVVMSGKLEEMATRLAWRVAASEAVEHSDSAADEEAEREQFLQRHALNETEIAHWVGGLGRDEDWLDNMIAIEAAYRARCATRLTAEACKRELNALRLPLTRFQVEMIELESKNAAQEALMCVRDDGMSMEEVAQEGRYPFHQTDMVLEEIAEDLQQKFLSLSPGSLLEPSSREDGYLLTRVLSKREPGLDESAVRARVEKRILQRHFEDLSSSHVQWRLRTTVGE